MRATLKSSPESLFPEIGNRILTWKECEECARIGRPVKLKILGYRGLIKIDRVIIPKIARDRVYVTYWSFPLPAPTGWATAWELREGLATIYAVASEPIIVRKYKGGDLILLFALRPSDPCWLTCNAFIGESFYTVEIKTVMRTSTEAALSDLQNVKRLIAKAEKITKKSCYKIKSMDELSKKDCREILKTTFSK